MSKLEELIEQYCPDGVEWKTLYSITKQFSGMTGVSNKWAEEGNCVFIDYNNVYNHTSVDTTALKIATVKSLKQNTLKKGDILFTSASETPDECALSSVIEKDLPDGVFLDDHLFGLRLLDEYSSVISPSYLKYAFRSEQFRFQIKKVVRGATRHYVSKVDFMKLEIPVPPLPVQEEIVRILDNFTELQAELQAELQKRKQQYNYYRDNLLSNGGNNAEYLAIPEFAELKAGKAIKATELSSIMDENHSYPCFGGNGIRGFIKKASHNGDYAIIGRQGALCVCVNWASGEFYATEHAVVCTPRFNVSSRYLYHLFTVADLNQYKSQGAQPGLSVQRLNELVFPIPSIAEQQRIVSILDRFDTLTNDLTAGLPAEIEKRRQQYEYYRDKLLTFKRKGA